ncbi:MAG: beta-galactosidase, partial [Candidatus Micrarchaeaceae archaeon]
MDTGDSRRKFLKRATAAIIGAPALKCQQSPEDASGIRAQQTSLEGSAKGRSGGHSVRFDDRSFIINGQRELLISGEMHYARSPRELWPVLLDRSVALGLNCVSTYVFWNFHEVKRDVYD